MPRPSPVAPWQTAQLSRKTRAPADVAGCPEAASAGPSPRAEASRPIAPGRAAKLLEDDQLADHVCRMQLALDRENAGLVSNEADRGRLVARYDLLHAEGGDLVAMLVRVLVDEPERDLDALLHRDRGGLPELHVLRRHDIDDGEGDLATVRHRGDATEQHDRDRYRGPSHRAKSSLAAASLSGDARRSSAVSARAFAPAIIPTRAIGERDHSANSRECPGTPSGEMRMYGWIVGSAWLTLPQSVEPYPASPSSGSTGNPITPRFRSKSSAMVGFGFIGSWIVGSAVTSTRQPVARAVPSAQAVNRRSSSWQ